VSDSGDLADRLPVRVRAKGALRHGALTYAEIAEAIAAPLNTVIQTLSRDKSGTFQRMTGPDGITRWGLAATPPAQVTAVI
jgi:hypothetical protein